MLTWDEAKRAKNLEKHRIDFPAADAFDWNRATVSEDSRVDYGEVREIAFGPIGGRLHVLVFTRRGDSEIHVISLRKANKTEKRRYDAAIEEA